MGVPQEILAVPRPTNTVVQDLGGNGPKRFAVLERKGIVHTEDGRSYPRNGKVIGHIIDGKFVAKKLFASSSDETLLSYGIPTLVKNQLNDIQEELHHFYSEEDVHSIMALVSIRVNYPGIASSMVNTVYRSSYAKRYWHAADVSKNALTSLLKRLGLGVAQRRSFSQKHVGSLPKGDHLIIGCTLKRDTSTIDDIPGYSYKAGFKEVQEIPLLYAFCIEKNEPACAEVLLNSYPGVSAVRSFLEHNGITSCTLITNKSFSKTELCEISREFPEVHFLIPLKCEKEYIAKYSLLDFTEGDSTLGKSGVFYKTARSGDGLFLYSFLDIAKAAKEQQDYLEREVREGTYDIDKYRERRDFFGTTCFISDIERDPAALYATYMDRWPVELALDRYKSDLDLEATKEQNNFLVEGNEFINFLCTLATFRILNLMVGKKLLEQMTYGQLVDALGCAQRSSSAPLDVKPARGDGYWDNEDFEKYEVLEAVGLCEPGNKKSEMNNTSEDGVDKPKRRVGRPRIHPLQ